MQKTIEGYRLSPQQNTLWSFQQEGYVCYVQAVIDLTGCLLVKDLQSACEQIIARHDILRTTFSLLPGTLTPIQVLQEESLYDWLGYDLSQSLPADQQSTVEELLLRERRRRFSLDQGPLVHICYVALSQQEHMLVVTMPALNGDRTTLYQFVTELAQSYAGQIRVSEDEAVQYLQVSEWQNELLEEEGSEEGKAYWQKHKASPWSELSLPQERNGSATSSPFQAEVIESVVPISLRKKIAHFLQTNGCSASDLYLSAWMALLWRLCGKGEVQIGLAINGRIYEELTEVAGPVTRYVPLSAYIHDRQSFTDVIALVQERVTRVQQMQQYFVEDTSVPSRAVAPFSFECVKQPEAITVATVTFALRTSIVVNEPAKISLCVVETQDSSLLQWSYNNAIFTPASIEQLNMQYMTLLEHALSEPGTAVSILPLFSQAEREQLLANGSNTVTADLWQGGVAQMFAEQVGRTPAAVAVVDHERSLSYAELDMRANQVAHFLQERGVGSETLVALCLPRCLEMVVSILAILKVGAAYLPLDPTYPKERLHFIVQDAHAALLLTTQETALHLPEFPATILLEEQQDTIDQYSVAPFVSVVQSDNLAYVIYTSGSTGQPKGAMITQRGLVNYLTWARDFYRVEEGSGAPVHSSLAFDLTVTSLFLPLLAGRCITLVEDSPNIEALTAVMKAGQQFSLVKITPAHLEMLNHELAADQFASSSNALVIGGEALLKEHVQLWRRFAPETRLINEYGPTETVVGCCIYDIPATKELSDAIPIGTPIANTQLYVLDECLQLVPAGMAGELYIGGEGIARGYFNRPDLTAERFIPNAFAARQGERLYKTGDIVRYATDGILEYVGRVDHQVKMRGFRIELGEIEIAIGQHAAVRESVVIAREDTPGDKQLVAYLVLRSAAHVDAEEIRAFLHQRLPTYMLPAHILFLDALPLTVNGKVNRHALPVPGTAEHQEKQVLVAPRTPIEQLVADIWCKVLNRRRVSIYDNFFEIGGHSLLATQLVARLRTALQVEITLSVLFAEPTVAHLAQYIEDTRRSAQGILPPPIMPVSAEEKVHLSFAQQRLWFLQQLEPDSTTYTIPFALRFQGELDVAALEQSICEIVRRHEVLRTTFQNQAGKPVPIVNDVTRFQLQHIDLSLDNQGLDEIALVQRLQAFAQQPFDIGQDLLFRCAVVCVSPQVHVLLICVHHLAWDGWSMGVFLQELHLHYRAFSKGEASALVPLPIQYADFAVWQRNWLQGAVLESQLAYWRQQLADAPILDLPTDLPRPALQSYRGARQKIELPGTLTKALQGLSQREGVTMFMTLLAAFQLLLSRYSHQEDICVGTPIANRNYTEIESLLGFFVNTLVLRTDLTKNPSFVQLLQRVRKVALDAYAYQDVPFEKLVEELQAERDPGRSPLFQVLFSLQNVAGDQEGLLDVAVSTISIEHETTKFDLSLLVTEDKETITCWFEYNTDLFHARSIERLALHWTNLLHNIVADPAVLIADLEFLSSHEQRLLLEDWSTVVSSYPCEASIQEVFEEQVRVQPLAIALKLGDRVLTYQELNAQANQVASGLRARGVKADTLVGLYIERSVEMIVGVLGILKAGGAYLPLDPAYPQERCNLLLVDSQVAFILASADLYEQLRNFARQLPVDIISFEEATFSSYSTENPAKQADAENLAYVLYTSGSTGVPKGVCATQRAVLRLVKNTTYLDFDAQETFLQLAPLSFDASTLEIWGSLLNGACLVICPIQKPSLAELAQLLVDEHISTLWLTAGLFHQMVDAHLAELAQVRHVLAGGDILSPAHVQCLLQSGQELVVINGYGPTENTTFTTCAVMTTEEEMQTTVPIGHPIANTQVYVLNERLQMVPQGVIGELYTGGDGLARGYLNCPDLTAERFIPHPFVQSGTTGERLYRTGDLARYRDDGVLEFMGRRDFQVKVRGFRIELGEIEAALAEHPAVTDHIVVVHVHEGDKQLVAYVAVREQSGVTRSDLRAFLREKLPDYLVPAQIILLKTLPLTVNGKVDRRALPEPGMEPKSSLDAVVAPRDPIQELLVDIWRQLLGRQSIGVYDNFFEIGGHSLLATQVVARIHTLINIDIALRVVFEAPTIALLAQRIGEKLTVLPEGSRAPAITAVPHEQAPLSFAQQRLWFLEQLEPGNIAYNIPLALRLQGTLHPEALEQSLLAIVARHESLRTHFRTVAGHPCQIIDPVERFCVTIESVENEQQISDLVGQEALRPFDLEAGPLFRARLLLHTEQDAVLLLTLHHSIADGWSMGVLMTELCQYYSAFASGQEPELAALPLQYADYAIWQREWLQGEVLDLQLNYWQKQLGGAETLEFPLDHPRPAVQTFQGASQRLELPVELSRALRQLSQREGATLFMTLLAAWQVLLSHYSRQDDISVGTPIANRTHAELEGLIGFFVNTLVLRSDLSGNPRFVEVLSRVKEVALGAYAHQDIPFERLVEVLHPERDRSRSPLFQVLFGVQYAQPDGFALPDLEIDVLGEEQKSAKFDLSLTVVDTAENLLCEFEYNTALFEATTIKRLLGHWQVLLAAIVQDPQTHLNDFSLLTRQERQQVLVDWNEPQQSFAVTTPLQLLFEQQAQMHPNAIAVSDEEQTLTYAQLNVQANQWAHLLRNLGVVPDQLVGLCVGRSVQMLVGLLAILKAGGAYLPLDPSYPAERLAFLVEDAQVQILLTQQQYASAITQPVEHVLLLDGDEVTLHDQSTENLSLVNTPDDLAYVIYTSGSTGQPKGVCISHANVVRLFAATGAWFQFGEQDVWTLFHSYAFDFSVWEIWGALLTGGRLLVVSYETSRTPAAFYQLLAREGVTVLNQTPAAFRQLQQAESELEGLPELALRYVIFGGEALELQSLRPWLVRHGDQQPQLINMYGITETTVHVTARRIMWADVQEGRGSLIGRAMPDLQLYVLNEGMQPVPIGVAGQLYVAGAGLARGYLRREALTRARFAPHPFRREAEERIYQTGDLVRYREDGGLEYLGRVDQQVKVRGFRIELGEIEAQLLQLVGIQACTVQVQEEAGVEKRLVGYLVFAPGAEQTTSDLRRALQAVLPEYMIPSAFVPLQALPLTAHGKLDRRALPPVESMPELLQAYVAPANLLEERLAVIWSAVLKQEKVSVQANFFTLGGDSIRSIQIVAQAKEQGLYFTLQQLFQYQTIAELAQIVQTSEQRQLAEVLTRPFSLLAEQDQLQMPAEVEDAYPLALMQAGMLYHSQINPASGMYHDITSYHVKTAFDQQCLLQVMQAMVALHPILRTSFDLNAYSEPLQLVHRHAELPFYLHDLRQFSEEKQRRLLLAWIEADKLDVLDTARAPLIRVTIHLRDETSFQFSLTCHHAILDGWSVASFFTELFQMYLERMHGTSHAKKASCDLVYRDFVALERNMLSSSAAHAYWEEKLADYSIATLPDWSSIEQESEDAPQVTIQLAADTAQALQRLVQLVAVPVKSILLTAHLCVINVLSGQQDTVTGIVTNGRPETAGGERILGLFLNTLPLRMQLTGGRWCDLIRRVFQLEREMLAYRWYPLAEIQRRHGGHTLFEVIFNYTHFHIYREIIGSTDLQVLGQHGFEKNNFALMTNVMVDPVSGQINLVLQSNGVAFTTAHLQTIAQYYVRVLEVMVQNPQGYYQEQNVLSQQELQQLLHTWNETKRVYPQEKSIHGLFEEQAERTPDAPAIHFEEQHLAYREVNRLANALAWHLISMGIRPGMFVGHYMERSPAMLVALLGILKAGGAYVPLDPSYPPDRIAYMLEDSQVQVIVTQPSLVAELPQHQAQVVCLQDLTLDEHDENPCVSFSAQQLAYIIYTSGSTGKPKGTMLPHQSVVNFFSSIAREPGMNAQDRILAVTSLSFDIAVLELLMPLTLGAQVFIASRAVAASGSELSFWLEHSRATLLQATPATWRMLLAHGWQGHAGLKMLCGGEVLPQEIVLPLLERGESLWNMYGPTETTIWSTVGQVHADGKRLTIGCPLDNTQVYVLDQQYRPVPSTVAGELFIAGDGLAWGYLWRPDLTADKFVPDPFSSEPGARMYRTGDLARWLAEGTLECLGRTDRQVKLRGHRIELGEIETVLAQHASVQACAVVVREDTPGDQQLVGYIVWQASFSLSVSELRTYLRGALPEYMLPGTFVTLDALPLTPNGKVDRKALPGPYEMESLRKDVGSLPRNATEELIAGIWSDILGREHPSIDENFFEIGGHSLLVNQLIARLRTAFSVQISIRSVFEAPTIAQLARVIQDLLHNERHVLPPPLLPVDRANALPLSFAQHRLWFLDQLEPDSTAYTIPIVLKLQGQLDVSALRQSLQAIVERHESLRTIFQDKDGEPVQVILPGSHFQMQQQDISTLDEQQRTVMLAQIMQQELLRPFALAAEPLFRALLVCLSHDEYALILVVHHIVWDGGSLNIFVRDLGILYQAYRSGTAIALPALPIQYADYASWQRGWLQGDLLALQLAYWQAQLSGAEVLRLQTDRPRPAVQTQHGSHILSPLSLDLSRELKKLSQREGVTLFMTLLAAFQTLLSCYSGQEDISVGTPIANRDQVELEELIGFFVNTLVLRSDLSGNPTFSTLLQRIRKTTLDAYMHQDVPFEELVKMLQPERDPSYSPLFQVLFSLQNATPTIVGGDLAELMITAMDTVGHTARYDLSLVVVDTEQGLGCAIEYNTDIFDQPTIERLLLHWQRVLEALVRDPGQHLSELQLLTSSEQQQMLFDWNDTDVSSSQVACLHQLFAAQAMRNPDQEALTFGDASWSYQELDQRSNQLARYLTSQGIGRGHLVGVCVERSFEMVCSILAILKVGAAYVPLDPSYPVQRLEYMVQVSAMRFILSQSHLAERISVPLVQIIPLDRLWVQIVQESTSPQAIDVSVNDLAYVIFTSGSTGLPKGVLISHAGIANLVEVQQHMFDLQETDRILQFASMSFDASIWELIMALCTGATLCLASADKLLPVQPLVDLIAAQRVSMATLPPSVLAQLHPDDIPSLTKVVVAGEACSAEQMHRWTEPGKRRFYNAYGPTESTVCATMMECSPGLLSRPPIGYPIQNTQVYLLDRYYRPVPLGVPGELYIGGVSLAWGYLQQPDLTAAKFIPHLFSQQPGARLYRTGDLARYLADGSIEFLGRIDHQVKLRGFRIELGEIEDVLNLHAEVQECIVIVREDRPGDQRLVAYLVSQCPATTLIPALRILLRERLPDYMLPSAFFVLEALPVTPNGKVDRKALPALDLLEGGTDKALVEPRTPIEDVLLGHWCEVLGRQQISIHANFFDLGGHSLLATQLLTRLRKGLGIDLPLRRLFEVATIAGQAELVEAALRSDQSCDRPPLVPVSRQQALPLSFAQQRLWFLDQLHPGDVAQNISLTMCLQGMLDLAALRWSLQEIIRRHESLRTNFLTVNGEVILAVDLLTNIFSLSFIDLSTLAQEQQDEQLKIIIQHESRRAFDLSQDSLFRTTLVRRHTQEHLFLISMHHIIADGWSIEILCKELQVLYTASVRNLPSPLPALALQYADFAAWQREWLQGSALDLHLVYWKQQLSGAHAFAYPLDHPRSELLDRRGANCLFSLPAENMRVLKVLSQQTGVTLFMTLLAAFMLVLSRTTGDEDVVVGTDVANRTSQETESLIGFFINLLALRVNLSGNITFRQMLERVRECVLGAYTHQDIPYDMLVDRLKLERNYGQTPLINTLFVLQNIPTATAAMQSEQEFPLVMSALPNEVTTAKFDFAVFVAETADGLSGSINYCTSLFDFSSMERLAHHFTTYLQHCIEQPDAGVHDIEMYSEVEKSERIAAVRERHVGQRRKIMQSKGNRTKLSDQQ